MYINWFGYWSLKRRRYVRWFFAAVGYAMVINMMATKETWPFFALGFVFACVSEFTLIALGVIGVVIAIVYLGLKDAAKNSGGGSNTGSGDPLGDILNDYQDFEGGK